MNRIGLIGCGVVTIKAHLPALVNDPTQPINDAGFTVTAICGIEEDKLDYISSKFPNAKKYTDYKKLIDSGLVDSVLIATGENLHLEIAEYALNNELFALIEKPASVSADKIEQFIARNRENLNKLQVGFNKRFYPGFLKVEELKSTSEFGEIVGGNIYFFTQQGRKPGKEGILSNLIHLCDSVCYLFGEPVKLSANFSKIVNDGLKGKTVSASATTKTGAVVSMLFTSSSNWNLPYHEQIQLIDNNRNHISIENNNKVKFTKCFEDRTVKTFLFDQSNSVFWNKDANGYKTQISEFYKLVSGKTDKPAVDIYDALAAHKLFERIFKFDE